MKVKDKTKDKQGDDEYLAYVNSRKGGQFKVGIDKKGQLQIVDANGRALTAAAVTALGNGNLTNKERALFNAITDTSVKSTVDIVRDSSKVLYGSYNKDGKNTVDIGDLNKLNASNPTVFTASNVALHETIESFTSGSLKTGFDAAHAQVIANFPGLGPPTSASSAHFNAAGDMTGGTFVQPIDISGGKVLETTVQLTKAIPQKAVNDPNTKPRPLKGDITSVKEKP